MVNLFSSALLFYFCSPLKLKTSVNDSKFFYAWSYHGHEYRELLLSDQWRNRFQVFIDVTLFRRIVHAKQKKTKKKKTVIQHNLKAERESSVE
jgi:lipopolysaccharide biosynthesis glycosyltransferase